MTKKKNASQGDFRYAVGNAKVPWQAVGEYFKKDDVLEVIRFLLPDTQGSSSYNASFGEVRKAVAKLAAESGTATKLTLGKKVQEAEQFAKDYLKVKHACFLTNWTAGMEIGYKLSGLRPGDEVIMPAITFIATMAYPLMIGAKVVFADIDPKTANLDPADVARNLIRQICDSCASPGI